MFSSINYCTMFNYQIRRNVIIKNPGALLRNIHTTICKQNKRDLTSNSSHTTPFSEPALLPFVKEHKNEFMDYFPKIVKSLAGGEKLSKMKDVSERFATLLENTVPTGDKIRGLTAVVSYKMLEKSENLTQENLELANILGWCAELLEAAVVVAEDIINDSEVSRNVTPWFRLPEVGRSACLDLFILEHCVFYLLKKNLSTHPSYVSMVDLIHDGMHKTTVGQILDSQKYNIDQLTMDTFNRIAQYKAGCCIFHFGVSLGMLLSKQDKELQKQISPILLDTGRYFQIKNDIKDYFATSKIGTQTRGKCTWLIARALQKADPAQRKIIENNYDKTEEEAMKKIQELYGKLDIPAEFRTYENESFISLSGDINKIQNASARNLLQSLVQQVYNRK